MRKQIKEGNTTVNDGERLSLRKVIIIQLMYNIYTRRVLGENMKYSRN